MIYRRAGHEDRDEILGINTEAEKTVPDTPFHRSGKGLIGTRIPLDAFFVAQENGRIVGIVSALPLDNHYWHVGHFYVVPEYRGNGVARGLLEAAAAWHRQAGRRAALIMGDPELMGVYGSVGFTEVGKVMQWEHE
jgi:GNAT superfamily N-acetyltransferase